MILQFFYLFIGIFDKSTCTFSHCEGSEDQRKVFPPCCPWTVSNPRLGQPWCQVRFWALVCVAATAYLSSRHCRHCLLLLSSSETPGAAPAEASTGPSRRRSRGSPTSGGGRKRGGRGAGIPRFWLLWGTHQNKRGTQVKELCELLGLMLLGGPGEEAVCWFHLFVTVYTVLRLHKLSSGWDPGSWTLIKFPSAWLRLYEFTLGWDPTIVSFHFFFLYALSTQMDKIRPCLFRRSLNKVCSC